MATRTREEVNKETVGRLLDAMSSGDLEAMSTCYREDVVVDWPQSGERIVGRENLAELNRSYPGAPTGAPRRITGSGDIWVVEALLDYGDDVYNACSIFEMEDGLIVRETSYFAQPFEAPQWRAQWVESIP